MSTLPKCPECRELLTVSIHHCALCGWSSEPQRASALIPPLMRQPTPPPDHGPQISREKMAQRIAELKAIVERGRTKPSIGRRREGGYLREVTREHGRFCMCEICFPIRMAGSRYLAAAESGAETPRTNGFLQRMRRHKSIADMELDELRVYADTLLEEFEQFAQQLERESQR